MIRLFAYFGTSVALGRYPNLKFVLTHNRLIGRPARVEVSRAITLLNVAQDLADQ